MYNSRRMSQCPSEADLMTLCSRRAEDALFAEAQGEREALLAHLDECDVCRELVAMLATEAQEQHAMGDRIGRYVLLEPRGAGAMGVVYSAYDPELDRKIAIKLLRTERDAVGVPATQELRTQRLLREARSLAKIAHPQVIPVYDVGTHEGEIFLAMELVDGPTLTQWLVHEPPRTSVEIVAMYVQAGRGLAAAHDVGIIHRDFKPDNVLVGLDGRARVTDFGLARSELSTSINGESPEALSLTRTGALTGTPLYMAPEQFEHQPVTAKTDQFSFGVALWSALYSSHPFAIDSLSALAKSVQNGELQGTPKSLDRKVAPELKSILLRALRTKPEQRFDTMHDLLAALAPHGVAKVARRTTLVAVAAGLCAVSAIAIGQSRARAAKPLCNDGTVRIEATWSANLQRELRDNFLRISPNTAERAFSVVQQNIARFQSRWAQTYNGVCRERTERGQPFDPSSGSKERCLASQRVHLEALLSSLNPSQGESLQASLLATQALPDPTVCARSTTDAIERFMPADPTLRTRALGIERAIATLAAQRLTGHFAGVDAVAEAARLEREATALNHPVLATHARIEHGWSNSQSSIALSDFREGLRRSMALEDWGSFVDASLGMLGEAANISAGELAAFAGTLSEVGLQRLGPDAVREADRLRLLCIAGARSTRDFEATMAYCNEARSRAVLLGGELDLRVAFLDDQMGSTLFWRGDYEHALTRYRASLSVREHLLGNSAEADNARGNIAEVLVRQGRFDEGERLFRALLSHEQKPFWLDGMAESLRRRGAVQESLQYSERALLDCEHRSQIGCIRYSLLAIAESKLLLHDVSGAILALDRSQRLEGVPPAVDGARYCWLRAAASKEQGQPALTQQWITQGTAILDGAEAPNRGPFGEIREQLRRLQLAPTPP